MKRIAIFLFILFLSACAHQDGTGEYRIATIGNAQRSIEANVLSAKPVVIMKQALGWGAGAGGAMGGAIAAESVNNAAVIIAGIIGGAIIGNTIEAAAAGSMQGHEYLLKTETGKLLTVAQPDDGNELLKSGDKAILVYGYPHRLIRDPR